MKKLIVTLSTIIVLSTLTIYGTKVVFSIKNSIEEYVQEESKQQDNLSQEDNQEVNNQINEENEQQNQKDVNEQQDISITKEEQNQSLNTEQTQSLSEEDKELVNDPDALQEKDTDSTEEVFKASNENQDIDLETSIEASATAALALDIKNPEIEIDAKSAILLDCNTGKVLYYKDATKPVYPASTTKLMTVLVTLDLCELEEEVTVGEEIKLIASDSSRAYLEEGEKLTIKMLLEGAIIPSGNDAAYVLATYCGRKVLNNQDATPKEAVEAFVSLMNQKVIELDLINTKFKNPDGYDAEGQYTTAYDMGLIAMEALKNETICEIAKQATVRNIFLSGEDITWKSSNKLISAYSGMYYKYAIGLKTGTSDLAGRCIVAAAEKDDNRYVCVVMNSTAVGRWEDSIDLLSYGIEE